MSNPHLTKLTAAIANPKASADVDILNEALNNYNSWISKVDSLTSTGRQRINDLTEALNEYKDQLEVELILQHGSPFLKRQKGQMKLDNSIMEEFLMMLVNDSVLENLPDFELDTGPHTAFMSMSMSTQYHFCKVLRRTATTHAQVRCLTTCLPAGIVN